MELRSAALIVELVVGIVASMAIGDYLGYKVGRVKLAITIGSIALGVIVLFAIYAAVYAAVRAR